jgi:hypothetical protein
MLRKLLLSLIILSLICLLINPVVYRRSDDVFYANPKFKKDQHFKLNQFINFKNKHYRAYLILDFEEMNALPAVIKKYRILRTTDQEVIKSLLDLNFNATGGDMATVTSRLVIYADDDNVFSSAISLDLSNPGLQHSALGWTKPDKPTKMIEVLSKFRPHYIPILILN